MNGRAAVRLSIARIAVPGLMLLATLALTAALPTVLSARTEEAEKFNQSADELLRKGDLRGAAIQLRNAVQKDPEDGLLRLKLAQVNFRLGDALAAEAGAIAAKERGVPEAQVAPVLAEALYAEGDFGRVLKSVQPGDRDPKIESVVRGMLGLAHLALGEWSEAEPMLRDAVRLDPANASAKLALVNGLLVGGKLDEADQIANEALATAPESAQALTAAGLVLSAHGNPTGALAKFTAALERDPGFTQARLSRVGLRIRTGDLDAAQQDLDAVSKVSPNAVGAIYFQALIQATRGDLKTADATLAKLGSRLGEPPETYYLAGIIKFRLDQMGQAEDYLSRYIAKRPSSVSAYVTLATISLRKGDPKTAIDQLNRTLRISPGNVQALALLGQAYRAQGDTAKAMESLEAAARTEPENPSLQAQVALGRMTEGQTTVGIEALERIFRAGDKGTTVGPTLVLTALRVGEFEKAVAAAEDLVKREPDNVLYEQLLGVARAANHDLPGAEAAFRHLLSEHPEVIAARRNLAGVYIALGRGDEARHLFDEPLKRDAKDVAALSALAEIDARLGNAAEAIDLLNRASAEARDSGPGLRLVAFYQSQKDLKSALGAATELLHRFPQDPAAVDAKAQVQTAAGDVAGALQTYRLGIDTIGGSALLLDRYARALMGNKDFATARDVLRRELALAPGAQTVRAQLVRAEYFASGLDNALATARSFGGTDAHAGEILVAQVLGEDRKFDEAIALLEKVMSERPSAGAVNMLSVVYLQSGQKEKAVDTLTEWTAKHPDDVLVKMTLARAYLDVRDENAARKEYETLLAIRESDPVILNNLAWLYQRRSDPRALELARRAYAISPTPDVADTLGWILTTEGTADSALKYLESASKARPGNFDMQYHLAVALQRTGKSDEARSILRAIVTKQVEFDSKADAAKLLSQLGG